MWARIQQVVRRVRPWLLLAVVGCEIIFVWGGLLNLEQALIGVVLIEALLILVVGSGLFVILRNFRTKKSEGVNGWLAAEQSLALVLPAPVARMLLVEPRLWWCLVRMLFGRDNKNAARSFGYAGGIKVLFWVIIGVLMVESTVVEAILAASIGSSVWTWVALGVHLYALVFLLGMWASFVTHPHVIDENGITARDGIHDELFIPSEAIVRVRAQSRPYGSGGRSGLKIDKDAGSAVLCVGPITNVQLELDPNIPLFGRGQELSLSSLSLTVDRPADFVGAAEHVLT
jgi:hypothetical protein